jgi:hypothetical protein
MLKTTLLIFLVFGFCGVVLENGSVTPSSIRAITVGDICSKCREMVEEIEGLVMYFCGDPDVSDGAKCRKNRFTKNSGLLRVRSSSVWTH